MKIPLLYKLQFELFKIIPVPVIIGKDMAYIEPSSAFYMVSMDRTVSYTLNEMEFGKCIKFTEESYWCTKNHPLYTAESYQGSCELRILKHKVQLPTCVVKHMPTGNYWATLYQSNSWIYSFGSPTEFDIICDHVYPIKLNGSGIIQINENCEIHSPESILLARKTKMTSIPTESILPNLDLGTILSERQNNLVKSSTQFTGTCTDDHSYAFVWTSGILVVINVGFLLVICWYRQPKAEESPTRLARQMSQHSV